MGFRFTDDEVTDLLLSAEQQIRLIDRVAPRNLAAERARLLARLTRGERVEPELQYEPPPDLRAVRTVLVELARALESEGEIAGLYAARALELDREASLVEAVGTPAFRTLSAARFPEVPDTAPALDALVRSFLDAPPSVAPAELIRSDDEGHPHSLLSILRARIGAARQPVRVELRPSLATIAAAGQDVVLIRPGVLLSRRRAERIAVHELEAHVYPRLAARRQSLGLFRTGSSGSAEHEEGRALLIEERAGFLDGTRQRELALRHLAAAAVRDGASLSDTIALLASHGATPESGLDMALRSLRGGGLARELVYLPAYLQIKAAFTAEPETERWFENGRVSLRAAQILREHAEARAPEPGFSAGSREGSAPVRLAAR